MEQHLLDPEPRTTTSRRDAREIDASGAIMLLGDTGMSILKAIARGSTDPRSIHARTGIPVPSIQDRVALLDRLKVVSTVLGDHVSITPLGTDFLSRCNELS